MPDIPSRLDFFQLARTDIVSRNTKIDPAQVNLAGSDVNIFTGTSAVLAAALMRQLLYRIAAHELDNATEEDLDRLVWDRYQLLRKGSTAAIGNAQISRLSTANGAGTVPIGTVITTTTGASYVTTSPASFASGDFTSRCDIRATEAGKATQIGARQLEGFANPDSLFDPTLTVTNESPTAGGEDAELDPTFRDRARKFWLAARRGTLGAIEFGALKVDGVVSAQAEEVLNSDDATPARIVYLYIADSTGVSSDALADRVRVALGEWRAAGIQVIVVTSLPEIVGIVLKLRFLANVDTVTLTDVVRTGVVSFVNSLPVNGPLYISQLYATLQRYTSQGLVVDQDTIQAPAGDIIPTTGQTLRTTLAFVVTAP